MTPPTTTSRRAWVGLAVLALPTLLLSLDVSVLHLALPHLAAGLGATATEQLWITDVYGFMIAGFLVPFGALGDRIGRRRILLLGAAAFGLASVAAAFAPSAGALIVLRALLGVAGATLMPSCLALIATMFPEPAERGRAIAVWMSCFMGGIALGPLVGGLLLEHFWWGSVFLMGVPVMVVLLLAGPVVLPEARGGGGRIDLVSIGLFLAGVLPAVYGVKRLAAGDPPALPVAALVLGIAAAVVFVRRQQRIPDPLLDLALLRRRTIGAALAVNVVGAVVMGGTFFLVMLHLQLVVGLSPLRAGLWSLPGVLTMIAVSLLMPTFARATGPGRTLAASFLVGGLGLALLSQVRPDGLLLVVVAFAVASAGMGPTGVVLTDLVVGSAPSERAGAASSLSETSGELGIALGVALLGSLATAVYRVGVADVEAPPEVAAAVRDSIAGAASVGAVDLGREAFTSALGVAGVLGATALLVTAGVCLRVLGRTRADDVSGVPA